MKKTANQIPADFWKTQEGRNICTAMHCNAWDALDCLNAQINALTTARETVADENIKSVLSKAEAELLSARAACRKAMQTLSDKIF